VERFGDEIHRFLFDNLGRIIPGWCAFINQRQPVYFNRPEAMRTPLADGDEIGILIALAGG
jgi:molybdopterin converting factor small subunit